MPAASLFSLAKKTCIKNVRYMTDIGDAPYDLLRPILVKIENPDQLRELEKNSPHLCGDTAELWRVIIQRDFPHWAKDPIEPKDPAHWHKIYRKLRLENEKKVDADVEVLKAALDGIRKERAQHTSKVVDPKTVPKLPRMGGMRAEPRGGGINKPLRSTGANPSLLTFNSGSKTKTLTGKGVIDKARREARELSLFSARKSVLTVPTHKLHIRASRIRSAPPGLVEDHRRSAADPTAAKTVPAVVVVTTAAVKRSAAAAAAAAASEALAPSGNTTLRPQEPESMAVKSGAVAVRRDASSSPAASPVEEKTRLSATTGSLPTVYRVPRVSTPDPPGREGGTRVLKKTAAASVFMPVKKRRKV